MTHIAFQPRGPEVEEEVDFIVVGSGAGGATAAVELARAGARVAVIEAGPWLDPEDYPHSTLGAMRDTLEDWGTQVTVGRALWPVVQGKMVGGTTVINSAICVRTPGDVFDEWRRYHGVGGDDFADSIWAHEDRIADEIGTEQTASAYLGRSNLLALAADESLGLQGHVITRYAKGCEGSGQCLQGCARGKKQSLNVNYLPEVLALGGSIFSSAPVDRIRFERGRATGVIGRFVHPRTGTKGARFRVRARRGVIVAASVTHSPLLLRRSGLRSRAIGAGFRAHPGSGIFGFYDQNVDANIGVTQGWATTVFRDSPGFKLETLSIPMEMGVSRFGGGGRDWMRKIGDYRQMSMWVQATRARTVGRVHAGLGGKPIIRYSLDRADMKTFRAGLVQVAEMHFAAGARRISPGVFGLPSLLEADQLDLLREGPLDPRAYVAVLSHLFGGCVMGDDPSRSVCSQDGKVHGVEGLHVADASIMPDNIGVNPQHTIMGLAAHVAHRALR